MSARDHLRAAARCWAHAGFFAAAAERYQEAEAWRDAGRCFSLAERHNDAAVAYSRAGEKLLAAREHLMAERPGHARRLYESLSGEHPLSPSQQVELLLTLRKIEEASRLTENAAAMTLFARLAASRSRPDLGWPLRDGRDLHSFDPWNRSLRFLPPAETETRTIWPSVEFRHVALLPVWEERTSTAVAGHRSLHWSATGTFFVAALGDDGLAIGRVYSDQVSLERRSLSSGATCAQFLPENSAVLTGERSGNVSLVGEDGQVQNVESLRMPWSVWSIEFSKQRDRLAIASQGEAGVGTLLKIFAWQGGQPGVELARYEEKEGNCWPICAWAHDLSRLVWTPGNWNGGEPIPNRLGMMINGEDHQIPNAHQNPVPNLRFTPDDRYLLSGSRDQTLVVRDGATGQALAPPELFDHPVFGVAIHPQAAVVAVGEGRRLHLLRLHPGEVPRLSRLSEQTFDDGIASLAFSPDGRHLLMLTYNHLRLFRVDLKP